MRVKQRRTATLKKSLRFRGKRKRPRVDKSNVKNIKLELTKMTNAVRQKFRNLKQETESLQDYFEQSAKPLVHPLKQQLADSVKHVVKNEPTDILLEAKTEKKEKQDGTSTQTDPLLTQDSSTQTDPGLSTKYLKKLSNVAQDKMDTVYGVRPDGTGGTMIGDSKIAFSNTHVYVQANVYRVTPGLMELLFMQIPNSHLITSDDVKVYKEIVLLTNAHRQAYSAEKPINSNRGKNMLTSYLYCSSRTMHLAEVVCWDTWIV